MAATTPPRTLAELLRAWTDEQVLHLLRERPDLAIPAPHDSAGLASRAATRSSILRALESLTRLELTVLDALVVARKATRERLTTMVHADPLAIDTALSRLGSLLLVWDSGAGLQPLSGVGEALRGQTDAGVSGLPPIGEHPMTPESILQQLAELSPKARAMLTHVVDHGGQAATGPVRLGSPQEAATPQEELVSRGLLKLVGGQNAVVPGEVGLALRGGRTTAEPVPTRPELALTTRDRAMVDRAGAGAAFEAVRRVELLLDTWGQQPPGVLRSGGLGVRELKAAAVLLHVSVEAAALVVEVARSAGLLAEGVTGAGDPVWLPTDAFDAWLDTTPAQRWGVLVTAWLRDERLPGLVGSKDAQGKSRNCLTRDTSSPWAPQTRRHTLELIGATAPGDCLATGTGLPSLVALARWDRPRRPQVREEIVHWTTNEAAALGLTGMGGATSALRALVAGEDPVAVVAEHLPEPVDHVLVQADLTAVAPGPLTGEVARNLHLVADVESRGGATVYRFSATSVRRALDAGWSAEEVHAFLTGVSRTPLPQPLTYLVDDVARTFGSLRVGQAQSFIRAEDELALSELLTHPSATALGLRRIAPTVLVSSVGPEVLLPRLREWGASPVVEDADGVVRVARPETPRSRTPRAEQGAAVREARLEAQVQSVLSAVRAGDLAADSRPARTDAVLTPAESLALLREAVEGSRSVLIGYTDAHGQVTERLVDPTRVEGGQLSAWDHRTHTVRNFALHRIGRVRPHQA